LQRKFTIKLEVRLISPTPYRDFLRTPPCMYLYTTSSTVTLKDLEKFSRYGILRDGIPQSLGGSGTVRYASFSDDTVRYGIETGRTDMRYETVQFFCSTVSL